VTMTTGGQSAHFTVSFDSSIVGPPSGAALAQPIVDYCEYDYARLSLLFGAIGLPAQNLPISVQLVPSTTLGGASNNGAGAIQSSTPPTITCYINPNFGLPPGNTGLEPLMVAELAEIFMALQGNGWDPGWSAGEGLSRVSAQLLYPPVAWTFAVGSEWYNPNTYNNLVDWVDNVEHTDQDGASYGCSSLFLNYLAYQLNYTWPAIIAAGTSTDTTLASKADALGVTNPYPAFLGLVEQYFPHGNLTVLNPAGYPIDDVFPRGPLPAQLPALYIRHNSADNGTSHAPPLADSPDIILKNAQVSNPQATYSTAASIASGDESDPYVLPGQANFVYLRVWNRSPVNAENVFATVYWSPVATLPTPALWNWIGDAYYPEVPAGSTVEVSASGVVWPADQIPAPGHYCFIATVGNNYQPPPSPQTLALGTFQDYYNYILNNNNITWRNFNVLGLGGQFSRPVVLPFLLTGGWDREYPFLFETVAELPKGSTLALQVTEAVGRSLRSPAGRAEAIHAEPPMVRLPLPTAGACKLGEILVPTGKGLSSELVVTLPPGNHDRPYEVAIRQIYSGHEVGRVTWRLVPGWSRLSPSASGDVV
jgi:hypothetical protein